MCYYNFCALGKEFLTKSGGRIYKIYVTKCFLPRILLIRLQIFKAGPSFRPIYFIITSEFSKSRAFPSISCRLNRSAWLAKAGSVAAMWVMTSSTVQSAGSPLGLDIWLGSLTDDGQGSCKTLFATFAGLRRSPLSSGASLFTPTLTWAASWSLLNCAGLWRAHFVHWDIGCWV